MARERFELEQFLNDPFAALRQARAAGPVVDMQLADAGVMHYERVRQLLSDPRLHTNIAEFLRNVGVSAGPFYEWMSNSPLNFDGADHQHWRGLMSRTFTPRRVEGLRPFLRTAAHALIDAFAHRGTCEFMEQFADAYPSLGLCELIGVPSEDRESFRAWANTIGLGFSPVVAMHIVAVDEALERLLSYTRELAARRRADPRDDLVTRIAQAGSEDGWTDMQVAGSIAGLVFAGHETTKNQLGWMVAVLAGRSDLWDAVGKGDLPAASLVEEVMRYRSAVTGVGRRVAEAVIVDGERLEPGEQVFLSLWSADHDEATYPKPDELHPQQSADTPHLAFGHGAHFCLGAALARAELQEALAALTSRLGCPTLGADATWKPPFGINGPERLPITFTCRPAR
jgi:cytochrome P450